MLGSEGEKTMKKFIMFTLALSLTVFLAACGGDSEGEKEKDETPEESEDAGAEQEEQDLEMTKDEEVDEDEIIASINGTDIKGLEYNSTYAQTKMMFGQQGLDVSDQDTIKEKVVDALVERELIMQDATEQGIEVSEKEVESELDTIKSENEEQFTMVLDQFNLTEDDYKEQLTFEIVLDEYMSSEFKDIEVTDDELKETYDELKEQNEEMPEFDEIKDDLKADLSERKEMEMLEEKIEELKDKADVETKI